jgi:hypothetical protein
VFVRGGGWAGAVVVLSDEELDAVDALRRGGGRGRSSPPALGGWVPLPFPPPNVRDAAATRPTAFATSGLAACVPRAAKQNKTKAVT